MKNGVIVGATVLILFLIAASADELNSFEDHIPVQSYKPKSNKPKKYKCILVDDDDNGIGQAGASYVSELQHRRFQAANLAESAQVVGLIDHLYSF
jgi:hypothetical protein